MFLKIIYPFASSDMLKRAQNLSMATIGVEFINVDPDTGKEKYTLTLEMNFPFDEEKLFNFIVDQYEKKTRLFTAIPPNKPQTPKPGGTMTTTKKTTTSKKTAAAKTTKATAAKTSTKAAKTATAAKATKTTKAAAAKKTTTATKKGKK